MGAFQRMVAWRYLRARRSEGFISVIAGFSMVGIALGVGTLIVVMAVMNGFRQELVERVLGLNGHLGIYGNGTSLSDYEELADEVAFWRDAQELSGDQLSARLGPPRSGGGDPQPSRKRRRRRRRKPASESSE